MLAKLMFGAKVAYRSRYCSIYRYFHRPTLQLYGIGGRSTSSSGGRHEPHVTLCSAVLRSFKLDIYLLAAVAAVVAAAAVADYGP